MQQVAATCRGPCVRVLLDADGSRFWTQFEAYLSLQNLSSDGFRQANEDERRYTAKNLHGCTEQMLHEFIKQCTTWRTPQQALAHLRLPECKVTNMKDKEEQLEKLADVCGHWEARAKLARNNSKDRKLMHIGSNPTGAIQHEATPTPGQLPRVKATLIQSTQ